MTKLNLDELFEPKKEQDLATLNTYNKILERAHKQIKTASRQKTECCWYVVPEFLLGIPRYDIRSCVAYIIHTLEDNGFKIKYTHPNLLFISWAHWVPDYVRDEYKKKTGVVINEYGERIEDEPTEDEEPTVEKSGDLQQIKNSKKYTPINSYKPSGKLVYSEDLLNKIENKIG